MEMRRSSLVVAGVLLSIAIASPAWACGGLVNPNGTVSLLRTTTFVGYVAGVEHYVTSFEYAGGGAEFGSIVPLPGVPTKVERAGDWTLQRLVQEVTPVFPASAGVANDASVERSAKVLYETRIDALDITILEGGGDEVGRWAKENGFSLTVDAPEILDFYADRSPIFMAARFDPGKAKKEGQIAGDGTPIHLTIPTPNPWVPLRILTLGLGPEAPVEADVFLLTEGVPQILPGPVSGASEGLILERSARASRDLLRDLASDKNMDWIPKDDMWFSYLRINTTADKLKHDLAIDATGLSVPSVVAAGLVDMPPPIQLPPVQSRLPWIVMGALVVAGVLWRLTTRTE